ncbi:MAG: carboxypeptidase regulatory-like domain-containing protein [archaeon]|nr:carboxypeptidase regulatory-like domain-containing protein [archaeon]
MRCQKRGFYVVLSLFLLVFFASVVSAQTEGCYVYPGGSEDLYCISGVLDTDAQADCEENVDCSFEDHFIPGSDCSEFDACRVVTCSVDCRVHALGVCQELGGVEVSDDDFSLWCSPGCCKVGNNFCQFNLNLNQCQQRARQLGVNPESVIFDNSIGMSTESCNQLYCAIDVGQGSIKGSVKDTDGNVIAGAGIDAEGITSISIQANVNGEFSIASLTPGTYRVTARAEGYLPSSASLAVSSNQELRQEFVLQRAEANAIVSISVTSRDGTPVDGATVVWSGNAQGRITTARDGRAQTPQIPPGDYQFTISKVGYSSRDQRVAVIAGDNPLRVILDVAAIQGVQGFTFIDVNSNGRFDANAEQVIYGAKIIIDGIFKGFSKFPDGTYIFPISVGDHKIGATYQDYSFPELEFALAEGDDATTIPIPLSRIIGDCTLPGTEKKVEIFSATQVQGEQVLKLEWTKPCFEVAGYEIKRFKDGQLDGDKIYPTAAENSYIDGKVEWNTEYTYEITALYANPARESEPTRLRESVNPGDEECEGRFHDPEWETFCMVSSEEIRKQVWTCNVQNQLISSTACAGAGEGANFYCAQTSKTDAECKDAGACEGLPLSGPFGLYHSRSACYGAETPEDFQSETFCYYDSTETIVNQCNSCLDVQDCFAYQSKDACEINSCLSEACKWVDGASNEEPIIDYGQVIPQFVTPETGEGYCVPVEEKLTIEESQCQLCGPENGLDIFSNYYCTADVCSGLGKCFSDVSLAECNACPESPRGGSDPANCYAYASELECVGNQPVQKDPFGSITFSDDQCGWNRCLWQGAPNGFGSGGCIKDGNGDLENDCDGFRGAEVVSCRLDSSAPRTEIVSATVPVISTTKQTVLFHGVDNFHEALNQINKMGVLGYCLESAEEGAPQTCLTINGENPFVEVPYPGRLPDEVVEVNLFDSLFLSGEEIDRKTYSIKYYSADKYHNQESVQQALIYVDTLPPRFEIQHEETTQADNTDLTVYLVGLDEQADCSFVLSQVLPLGGTQNSVSDRNQFNKQATFPNLNGIRYSLNATCIDLQGNEFSKVEELVFDQEQRIDVISPIFGGVVASTEVIFEVTTDVGAQCALYETDTNVRLADFVSDEEGKSHRTSSVSGFIEREYAATQKVVCQELLTGEMLEDYFHFTVDFTPPEVQIILREGAREEQPIRYGWEESFIESVEMDFECTAEGFACDQVFYCLGDGCQLINNPNYREYAGTVTLSDTTQICYYGVDVANSPVYQPKCGTVKIEGYGINLEKPEQHLYGQQKWGISNEKVFDVIFFTRIPTVECRFDFSSGFSYDSLPAHKILNPNGQGRYVINNFPESVFSEYSDNGGVKAIYVQCKDHADQLSPEQELFLEYDPTAPKITDARADPDRVLEGITTTLFTSTDDKTLCRYSDDSEEQDSASYETMEFSFPGEEERLLGVEHQELFTVGGVGDSGTKDYLLNVQCRNGAGDFSEVENIEFAVDYTEKGFILPSSLQPQGYLTASNVVLSAETSKSAICEYDLEDEFTFFTNTGSSTHTVELNGLAEQEYQIPVRCRMGDHVAFGLIEFIIDRTSPILTSIDDGKYSCGTDQISVLAHSEESSIVQYDYQIIDKGLAPNEDINASSVIRPGGVGAVVLEGTTTGELPIIIPASNLTEGRIYSVKVKAVDAAGNVGQFFESDGVIISSDNITACLEDLSPPEINVLTNTTCLRASAELECNDETGCSLFQYGVSDSSDDCDTNKSYLGQRIEFDKSSWLCYSAVDTKNQSSSGKKLITFGDIDGDGVADQCDECDSTGAGKASNMLGCSADDVQEDRISTDSDHDGLPDDWERSHNALGCDLNPQNPDSNGNGISDPLEDYDDDGFSTFEEYVSGSDPCIANRILPNEPPTSVTTATGGVTTSGTNVLAWTLLIIGILLVLGGVGYLVYYYKYAKTGKGKSGGSISRPSTYSPSSSSVGTGQNGLSQTLSSWKNKLRKLDQSRSKKVKQRERSSLFGEFSQDSQKIPHIGNVLSSGSSGKEVPKLHDIAKKYVEHKDEIKPGLRQNEKDVFAKLESIAKKAEKKDITEVVSPKEAKDIFAKLKELSNKRKK